MNNVRNFCIIAHIDHGKSTLSDRLLEFTGTVNKRDMKAQLLDTMDLERERGITIKLQPVRMDYTLGGTPYILNLIDTPGHVDFTYEVSRSLAACEGAVLLVDATQGVQAQTIANLYLALDQGLTIIPVINKIDLAGAEIEKTKEEIVRITGCKKEEIIEVSGKTGQGVLELLQVVIDRVPAPKIEDKKPLRALIFDSNYDEYRGVVAYIRVVDGRLVPGMKVKMLGTGRISEVLETGYFKPKMQKSNNLETGEIGYVVTGVKNISKLRVGDTIAENNTDAKALPGYKNVRPMVYAGIFPKDGSNYAELREAMDKLKLSDASLDFEPERSEALGVGFRVGFLGLLHLEIITERIKREFDIDLMVTAPSVAYEVHKTNGEKIIIKSPQELPDPSQRAEVLEPWVKADIVTPKEFMGNIMQLVATRQGEYKNTEYIGDENLGGRVILHYEMPLASVVTDFYDKLKSTSSGYASLNYELAGQREAEIDRLDILVAESPVEALSTIVYRDTAYVDARRVVDKLKDVLPRQMFEVKIQAILNYRIEMKGGGKIIASNRIPPMKKDVTAKLYGGDVTRKRKLLEKQKKGKRKMKEMGVGRVDIPPEAFTAILKKD
ncbi:MAG: elongation factor 4 [Parcubacteria group bacterium CG10_big_fil_rev_8_21_14_0_10_36_14]|nr:MAG: elongation factor 4 [Parcubacteria group bacterium CG10_big_fil_rev_8_21_14_0_10_36_14]